MLLAKFIIKCYGSTGMRYIKHLKHSALINNTDSNIIFGGGVNIQTELNIYNIHKHNTLAVNIYNF